MAAAIESDLTAVTLVTQISLHWPNDGRLHWYGPGAVKLPSQIVSRLHRMPHRVVAR